MIAQTCSICVEEIKAIGDKVRTLPECNHVFHSECISKWLTGSRPTCPNCNRNVRESGPAELRNFG